jgi:hypothetical protein
MKPFLVLLLSVGALCAQDAKGPAKEPTPPSKWQGNVSPNDERVKIFTELEAKAQDGDIGAVRQVGEYLFHGTFPVAQNKEKGQALWLLGATMGDEQCAGLIHAFGFADSYDSEVIIEKTKWLMIHYALRARKGKYTAKEPTRPNGVSESSFQEAKTRAEDFLSKVTLGAPDGQQAPAVANTKKTVKESSQPHLRFESLGAFEDHRRKVTAAYMKASNPIYNKGEAATKEEKAAFTPAAIELARLQGYVGKRRSIFLKSDNEASMELNRKKMQEAYGKMAAAEIKTTLPATRAELNEASKYMNALGELMRLPVALQGSN